MRHAVLSVIASLCALAAAASATASQPPSAPPSTPTPDPEATIDGDEAATNACDILPNGVVVEISSRRLHLCQDGLSDVSYPVNLGQGGSGKTKQGDQKTPLGRYALGAPRKSFSGFTWFVPVGYPTRQQRAAGYTGGSIGIHGPPDWLPETVVNLAFSTPWTDGCIMVRTKREIEEIRAWLLAHKTSTIEIVEAMEAVVPPNP
ncbi:MAG: L,D-transpeptidase family protein [Deltaproteobacteria bacterium]|nr:L,D-transpeptidase family protein [Deltaproteobacteria bacterium]